MAVEPVQGLDAEVLDQLANKHGPELESLLVQRWGTDWAEPARKELDSYLGTGWEAQPAEAKSEALSSLIVAEDAAESSPDEQVALSDDAYPSLADSPWIASVTEASTFEEWLVQIGVDSAMVDSFASSESSEGSEGESADAVPPIDDLPWITTVTEASTFEEWLVRIGIDAATVESLTRSTEGS